MLPPQCPARDGEYPRNLRRIEQCIEDASAHEATGAGEQRYDGVVIGHGTFLALSPGTHKLAARLHCAGVRSITAHYGKL
jgi:hypothetical protein